ncbi:gluconate 2-dehydrogenase subunit 3 family protein [Maribacter chungangensis]|uniref:Gluconate 2-dehydrogenase subunit 3 family protein n=1 Tax=Maribacter chungangensis TaxID=1069117 RepID=A0ABW3B077_9FLAO
MKRKTFIHRLTLGTGGLLAVPSLSLMQGCEYRPTPRTTLSEADIPLLDEIGEAIIPTTADSPGAKAVNIGAYMLLMYQDCMPAEEQGIFLEGLNDLDARAAKTFSSAFESAKAEDKLALLQTLQVEAEAYYEEREGQEKIPPHYFQQLKSLTLSGYFTSEIGMTQAREYLPLPGKFEACIQYEKGTKVWAT